MFLHPNSAPLWREYLLFTQSYFSSFAVSKVNAAYGKCLSTLSAVRDGSMVSHPSLPGIEEDMLGKRCGLLSIHSSLLCHLGKKRVLCFYVKYIYFFFHTDIFLQQCHFLRQSGHSEKAISLFQAMMDFTFFKPDSVRELTTKQQVHKRKRNKINRCEIIVFFTLIIAKFKDPVLQIFFMKFKCCVKSKLF